MASEEWRHGVCARGAGATARTPRREQRLSLAALSNRLLTAKLPGKPHAWRRKRTRASGRTRRRLGRTAALAKGGKNERAGVALSKIIKLPAAKNNISHGGNYGVWPAIMNNAAASCIYIFNISHQRIAASNSIRNSTAYIGEKRRGVAAGGDYAVMKKKRHKGKKSARAHKAAWRRGRGLARRRRHHAMWRLISGDEADIGRLSMKETGSGAKAAENEKWRRQSKCGFIGRWHGRRVSKKNAKSGVAVHDAAERRLSMAKAAWRGGGSGKLRLKA